MTPTPLSKRASMKRIDLQDVFFLNGKLVQCIGTIEDKRVVALRDVEPCKCDNCGALLPPKLHHYVETAPILQENILPVKTIE